MSACRCYLSATRLDGRLYRGLSESTFYLWPTISKPILAHWFSYVLIKFVSVVLNFEPLHLFEPLNFLDWAKQSTVAPCCAVSEHLFVSHSRWRYTSWSCGWTHDGRLQYLLFILPLFHFEILSKTFLKFFLEIGQFAYWLSKDWTSLLIFVNLPWLHVGWWSITIQKWSVLLGSWVSLLSFLEKLIIEL